MKWQIKQNTSISKRELLFLPEEAGFVTIDCASKLPYDGEIIINTLSFGVINNECVAFDGYFRYMSCVKTKLMFENNCPEGTLFIDDTIEELENADDFPMYLDDFPMSLGTFPTYIDKDIICIGDKDAKASKRAEIFKNCIISLDENGEFLSIYIKVVRVSIKEYKKIISKMGNS